MKPDLTRYELFGWDYEHHAPPEEEELGWYRRFAGDAKEPILELACGTGRLLSALAEDGHECVGVDLSRTMLDLARERISSLPPESCERVRLCEMDITDFQLPQRFHLVIIADNSFRELSTKDMQLRCLERVRHHLTPGGQLLVTVRRFDPGGFVDGERHLPWSEPVEDPATGDCVTRKIDMKLFDNASRVLGSMTYRTVPRDGVERLDVCPFEAPVMLTADYMSLFSSAGFSSRVFVGYGEKEDDGRDPILCFVSTIG
jgi:SAM-dependent methyltransferase